MPQSRNYIVNFVAGKLAALAGFGALRHLDLQFVGIHQVIGGHSKTRRGHLLHRAAAHVAVGVSFEAGFVFTAFSGVRLTANPIHRDGERLVRLLTDRAE